MTEMKQVGDLQIAEDVEFQRSEWRVERFGWAAMALIVLFALLGLFGGFGPLSEATAGDAGNTIQVDYDRFMRYKAPSALIVHIDPAVIQEGEARFWFDRDYLAGLQIQQISPQPDQVEVEPDRITFTFMVAEADRPVEIVFNLQPDRIGMLSGSAGLEGAEALSFDQWVHP